MHAERLLHKFFGNSCQIDKRINKTLCEAVSTLMFRKKLSIFGIARFFPRPIKIKHSIKCIDRLFGNKNLHSKRSQIYQVMINALLLGNLRPVIVIDWSGITRCGTYHMLRASLAVKGRSLTLYEQCYPISEYVSQKTHRRFLLGLKTLLPKDCHPIIVTDAGFRNSWFKLVACYGWDFMGRIRHKTLCQEAGNILWQPVKGLYSSATTKERFLGQFSLALNNRLWCNLYLWKQKRKHRERRNLAGKKIQSSVSLKHAKRENEPWLIATSIDPKTITAKEVMRIYKKRMQIEEAFRDLKNSRNGFSLRQCRSFSRQRLDIALLIGTMAMFMLWLIGLAAKHRNIHHSFQSNTVRNREVLSVISIGWQTLERQIYFSWLEIKQALHEVILYA